MNAFESNIISMYGSLGKAWLDGLPGIIKAIALKYGLSEFSLVNDLKHNYVLSAAWDNKPVILKCSFDIEVLQREAKALKTFAEYGAVNILAEDKGMLILERVIPGGSLKSYFWERDEEAIRIVCNLTRRLHLAPLPKAGSFLHIKNWLLPLDKEWNIPTHYLHRARRLRDDLLSTSGPDVLLHGDLHHDNILFSANKSDQHDHAKNWLIIDPKGVIGEEAYEVAAFIRNPIPELIALEMAPSIINNRINIFAEILEIPTRRILDWCFVQAVLSLVWSIEDHEHDVTQSPNMVGHDSDYFRKLVKIFDDLLYHKT